MQVDGAKQRFTLIELLVVIAVIAVLAAMLLPALSEAKVTAVRLECMGRQKQLSMMVHTYQADSDDYIYAPDSMTGLEFNAKYNVNCLGPRDYFYGTMWHQTQGYSGYAYWTSKVHWVEGYKSYVYGDSPPESVAQIKALGDHLLQDPGASPWMSHNGGSPNNHAVQVEGYLKTLYPYMARAGHGCVNTNGYDSHIYRWAYSRRHARPEKSLITFCPSSYAQHPVYGYGFYVGSHMRQNVDLGPVGGIGINMIRPFWRGHNVALGDGHVEFVGPNKIPGEYTFEVSTWYHGSFGIKVKPVDP